MLCNLITDYYAQDLMRGRQVKYSDPAPLDDRLA
jgi:hypothetical protein